MQPGLHAIHGEEPEYALPLVADAVVEGFGVALEEAVEHDLVAVLVGVR